MGFSGPELVRERFAAAAAASAQFDRRAPLTFSVAGPLCCGRTDAEVRRRSEAIGMDGDEVRAAGGYVGTDLDHLDLVAAGVAPAL